MVDALSQNGAAVLNGPRRGLYSTKFAGLSQVGIPTFYDENGEVVFQYDLQSRDKLNETLKFEGSTEPRGSGGFTNTFNWKGLSFSFLFSYKFDYKIRLNEGIQSGYSDFDALPAELVNRWVVPGDENITDVPVILSRAEINGNSEGIQAYSLYNLSNIRVADGDYIRLKNIRLSYLLPTSLVKKMGLNSLNVSLEGQNLWLVYSDSALNGQDPEFFSSGGVSLPQPKLITFSLNIGL
jgi:hypothetical protein